MRRPAWLRAPTAAETRWALRWAIAPLLAGLLLGSLVDVAALPFVGRPQYFAVALVDGQAYFGRIDDVAWSDTVTLRDVSYLQDARDLPTDVPVALVKRGSEVHVPADAMRIRREKVLFIERIGPDSAVARAMAAQRTLDAIAAGR